MQGRVGHLTLIRFRHGPDAPEMFAWEKAAFAVHAIADRAPGFVWRMTDEGLTNPDYDVAQVFGMGAAGAGFRATLSVWAGVGALDSFTNGSLHAAYLRRRSEWTEMQDGPGYVIWPLPDGHIPTLQEGRDRLSLLAADGAGERAFDLPWWRQSIGRGAA